MNLTPEEQEMFERYRHKRVTAGLTPDEGLQVLQDLAKLFQTVLDLRGRIEALEGANRKLTDALVESIEGEAEDG